MKEPFDELVKTLASVEDEKLIKDFFICLLTESELEEIGKRWALVRLLDKGYSQRKIAETLHLSLCKITRGSRELKKENSAFRYFIDLFKKISEEKS